MLGNSGTIQISIEIDDKGTIKVRQFGDEVSKVGRKGKGDFDETGRSVDGLNSRLDKTPNLVAKVGAAFAALALGAIAMKVRSLTDEWDKLSGVQEKAEAGVMQAMMAMNRYTDAQFENLKKTASGIQRVTTAGDEAILSGTKFLLTYRGISDDVLPRAMSTMADIAALMGGDMTQAANMLGKASMGMTGELRRMGITVDENTFKTKGFLGVLQEIENQVGGQARAMARTKYGGLEQMNNLTGDLKERLGDISLGIKTKLFPTLDIWIFKLDQIVGRWEKILGLGQDSYMQNLENAKKAYQRQMDVYAGVARGDDFLDKALGWLPGYITKEEAREGIKILKERIDGINEEMRLYQEDQIAKFAKSFVTDIRGMPNMPPPLPGGDKLNDGLKEYRSFLKSMQAEAEATMIEIRRGLLIGSLSGYTNESMAGILYDFNVELALMRGQADAEAIGKGLDAEERASEERTRIQERELEKRIREWERFYERIENFAGDAVYNIMRDWDDGWSAVMDNMKELFLRTMAQMIAKQWVVPVVVQMVSGVTGIQAPGMGGVGSGGLGNMPGMSNLGSSFLSKPMWYNGDFGGYGFTADIPTATPGPTWGGTLAAGMLGSLGYSTIGNWMGLPQSKYSGLTSGLGGSLGYMGGTAMASSMAMGATMGSVVPIVGTIIGAALGGILGGALGGDKTQPRFGLHMGSGFEDGVSVRSVFGDMGFRQASHDMDANKFKPYLEGLATIDQALANFLTDEEISRVTAGIDHFKGYLFKSFSEESFSEAAVERFKAIGASLGGTLGDIISAFEGTAGEMEIFVSNLGLYQQVIAKTGAKSMEEIEQELFRNLNITSLAGLRLNLGQGFEGFDMKAGVGDYLGSRYQFRSSNPFAGTDATGMMSWFLDPANNQAILDMLEDLGISLQDFGSDLALFWNTFKPVVDDAGKDAEKMTGPQALGFSTWGEWQGGVAWQVKDWRGFLTEEERALKPVHDYFGPLIADLKELGEEALPYLTWATEKYGEVINDITEKILRANQAEAGESILSQLGGIIGSWQGVSSSAGSSLMQMMYGSSNPATGVDRLAGLRGELTGMGFDSPEEASRYIGAWGQYLALGQQTYQRPSLEYQRIYDEVVPAIKEAQDYADAQAEKARKIQEDQLLYLEKIAGNTEGGGTVYITLEQAEAMGPEELNTYIMNVIKSPTARVVIQDAAKGR